MTGNRIRRCRAPLIVRTILAALVWSLELISAAEQTFFPVTVDEAIARVSEDERDRLTTLRERILETTAKLDEAAMADYIANIPKTGVPFDMVRISGGDFLMGSPQDEAKRHEDEGPQVRVKVSPFWMGRFETTWDQYEPFMFTRVPRNKDGSPQYPQHLQNPTPADFVSSPTTPYLEMDFEMGKSGYPAICMTHHAANKFCEWLSFQTGHFYRLPTEAEWEYACRAGTTGPYSCPTDQLAEFAILDPRQIRVGYEKVGTKKPNPWGLFDMHGNVMEWCLDQYRADTYAARKSGPVVNPLARPETRYPRVARGGSWYDLPEELRSARRIFSESNWQQQDPELPKSLWYLTDAVWLGFRIVRPLAVPSLEEMIFAWNNSFLDAKTPERK
ncbi:MAG: formylglycine-generating enzyme family protein [Verrucomicrobiales bacterium]|nr:formylglycine-generating enzyme family protein [Verrucomicrobiales bacterium]